MNKVFQTIVDPGKGNCMQAVVASLLNEKLEKTDVSYSYKLIHSLQGEWIN